MSEKGLDSHDFVSLFLIVMGYICFSKHIKKAAAEKTCGGIIGSGKRKGEKCGGIVKEGREFCSKHTSFFVYPKKSSVAEVAQEDVETELEEDTDEVVSDLDA